MQRISGSVRTKNAPSSHGQWPPASDIAAPRKLANSLPQTSNSRERRILTRMGEFANRQTRR
jgi:hypothetical protein